MTRVLGILVALVVGMSGRLTSQQADPLHDVVIGDGTLHLTQTQTQAALIRVVRAVCRQIYPDDTTRAHHTCLVAMRDALSPPAHYSACSNKPRMRDGQEECWRQDLDSGAWDWFPAVAATDSSVVLPR